MDGTFDRVSLSCDNENLKTGGGKKSRKKEKKECDKRKNGKKRNIREKRKNRKERKKSEREIEGRIDRNRGRRLERWE